MTIDRGSFAPLSSDHVSPTLKMLEADRESDNPHYAIHEPEAACTSCPIAVWYLEGDDLECFCPALHRGVWGLNISAIKLCDAREQAIAERRAVGRAASIPE
ncbi:hypothetical protein [Sphingopyxis terrae]|uniref:hypothetical protein n=1 Tax=Sphingopyxis terrae TaxID=33052 RepID=UPI001C2C4A75|nr:hypothetical protein [Sphingopyxis terrae]QXF11244.1 hypothetical protein HBA51_03010 [Sphingopyxis terrae subsp. terrae]